MAKKEPDPDALVALVERTLRDRAALPAAELRAVRRHLGELRPRLEALGLEVTASQVRQPLATQLRGALAAGGVGAPALLKRVAGASAKEARAALEQLVVDGAVREVVRSSGTTLVLASKSGADGDEDALIPPLRIDELLRRLAEAQKLLKRASAKKGKRARPWVHHDDVLGPLLAFARSTPSAISPDAASASAPLPPAAGSAGFAGSASIARAIRARAEQSALPLRIPELLRALGVDKESGKRALLEGASAGLFGLEPESGMARLAPLDASWCPDGPQGTLLSWVVARQKGAIAR